MEQSIFIDFNRGDETAFRCIYDNYSTGLLYFAARYISDTDQRFDVLQEAFISLWEKRNTFDREAAVKAYLYRVVQTSCLNMIRHRKVEINYAAGHKQADEISSFLEEIFEAEVFQEVAEAFQELAPAAKRVYELSLSGMKHEEIASLLSISINTIKKHKNNANHFLKRKLKHLY